MNPISGQMGSTMEWNISLSGILSKGSSGIQSSFEMKNVPPTTIVSVAYIRKLSAKKILSGLTEKVISLNDETRKNYLHNCK